MVQKTERFEIRLEPEMLERVDQWRSSQSDVPSRAEAMRRLLDLSLSRFSKETLRFSDGEKLLVSLVCDLYEHFNLQKTGLSPNFIREMMDGGHYWAAKWKYPGIFHDHADDPKDLRFVVAVLDTWDYLEASYDSLPEEGKAFLKKNLSGDEMPVRFMGFDGNHEAAELGIARFLIEKMDRFSRFEDRELNSHYPTTGSYRALLENIQFIRKNLVGRNLTARQLLDLMHGHCPTLGN